MLIIEHHSFSLFNSHICILLPAFLIFSAHCRAIVETDGCVGGWMAMVHLRLNARAPWLRRRSIERMLAKKIYFELTFQSFCLNRRRVPSEDKQLNFSLIGHQWINSTNTISSQRTSMIANNGHHRIFFLLFGKAASRSSAATTNVLKVCALE